MSYPNYSQLGAYQSSQNQVVNDRDVDARALATCAGRMQEVLDAGDTDRLAYGDAIRMNQKLWTIFQLALCEPDNALPRDLKVNLLSLSKYVDRVSFEAMKGYQPQILKSLININRILAAGLAKKPEGQNIPASGVGGYTVSAQTDQPPVSAPPMSVMTSA